MKRTYNEVCEQRGRGIMDYAPSLGIRGKMILFESSNSIGGSNKLTKVDTYLRIATLGAIVASTYSLSVVVSDARSRDTGDRTRMNNTKADGLSVPSGWSLRLEKIAHRMRVFRTKYT